jgi:CRISPR-associated protein Csm4
MPTLVPYSLTFRSGLHLGTRGVNLEEAGLSIPSDTLFAAVLDICRRQGLDVAAFAAPFVTRPLDPPFLLTSAFPRAGNVRFYPLPVALDRILKPDTLRQRGKAVRRVRYLSEGLLRKVLAGGRLDDDLFPADPREQPTRGAALQGGALWFSLDEMEQLPQDFRRAKGKRHSLSQMKVWDTGNVPRVTISRISQVSNVFSAGRTVFAQDCGLWFGVSWRKPDERVTADLSFRQALDSALHMLQHDGLGGERSTGSGAFELGADEPAFEIGREPKPGDLTWLLSRYHPRREELPSALDPAKGTAYSMVAISGWLRSPEGPAQRRKRLFMLTEGSLVAPPALPGGDVVDVQPVYEGSEDNRLHPVYRYGLALGLGL